MSCPLVDRHHEQEHPSKQICPAMWSSLANAAKNECNAMRLWPQASFSRQEDAELNCAPRSIYHDKQHENKSLNIPCLRQSRAHNLRISQRTFLHDQVTLQGWPSRGGLIVLENATAPDFDFLRLDPLDPPLRRDANQNTEDAFCQALLRLGAIWWDSDARRDFVRKLENGDEEAFEALDADETLAPTPRERVWTRVAWPEHTPGALCVLACEKPIDGRRGDEKIRPRHYGVTSLARTMDERCTVLQRLGGVMYASIEDYQDSTTFLKAWEEDH